MDFDGSRFYGVDEEAYNETFPPADTVFTHYLWANARFLERSFDSCGSGSLQRLGDPETGIGLPEGKLQTAVNEMILRAIPISLDRIPRKVVIQVWGSTLISEFSARLDLEEASYRVSKNRSFGRGSVRLEIEISELTRPQSGLLMISHRALDVTRIPAQSELSGAFAEAETVINIQPSTLYSATNPANYPFFVGAQATGRDSVFSFIASDHVLSFGSGQMAVTGLSAVQALGGDTAIYNVGPTWAAGYLVYVDYNDDYFRGAELRANIPEFSDVNRRFAAIQERQYTRPRLIAHGSQGRRVTANGWPSLYRSDWVQADGDGGEVTLFRASVDSFEDLASVTAYPMVLGAHMVNPAFEQTERFADFERLWEARAVARWIFRLKVFQFENGSATAVEIASTSREVGIPHLPVANLIDAPALHQMFIQKFFEPARDYQWTYNEGRLQDEDLRAIVDFNITLRSEDLEDLDPQWPFDVVLTAELSGDFSPVYNFRPTQGWGGGAKVPGDEYDDPEFLRLLLVGHSVYGRRE